jgi:hypothetical protein
MWPGIGRWWDWVHLSRSRSGERRAAQPEHPRAETPSAAPLREQILMALEVAASGLAMIGATALHVTGIGSTAVRRGSNG